MSKLLSECNTEDAFVAGVKKNIALTKLLIEEGKTPGTLAIVSGSESAKNLWQKILDGALMAASSLWGGQTVFPLVLPGAHRGE